MTPVETLREAARLMREHADARWHAVADGIDHEVVLALEADHLAAVASDTVMSNIAPSYRPATLHAFAVARAYLGETS